MVLVMDEFFFLLLSTYTVLLEPKLLSNGCPLFDCGPFDLFLTHLRPLNHCWPIHDVYFLRF